MPVIIIRQALRRKVQTGAPGATHPRQVIDACVDVRGNTRSKEAPNGLVRFAFYLSLLAIPFSRIYIPGTGERLGVMRFAQIACFLAALSQPRVCIRRVPVALFFFASYCIFRIAMGYFVVPGLLPLWLPSTLVLLQLIVLAWFLFNVLQFEGMSERGLLMLLCGTFACAAMHLMGIGTREHGHSLEGRISIFDENANVVATTYGLVLVAAVGLLIHIRKHTPLRYFIFAGMAIIGSGLALTGSRRGAIIVVIGLALLLMPIRPVRFEIKKMVLLVLVGGILAGVLYFVPTIAMRFEQGVSGTEDEPRRVMYPVLWKMFMENPVFGRGPEEYREELTWRAMPYRFLQGKVTITAHHLALLMLVETGVIGFGLFAAGIVGAVKAAWRARRDYRRGIPFALIIPLIIVGLISCAPQYYGVFWVAVAYALAAKPLNWQRIWITPRISARSMH